MSASAAAGLEAREPSPGPSHDTRFAAPTGHGFRAAPAARGPELLLDFHGAADPGSRLTVTSPPAAPDAGAFSAAARRSTPADTPARLGEFDSALRQFFHGTPPGAAGAAAAAFELLLLLPDEPEPLTRVAEALAAARFTVTSLRGSVRLEFRGFAGARRPFARFTPGRFRLRFELAFLGGPPESAPDLAATFTGIDPGWRPLFRRLGTPQPACRP